MAYPHILMQIHPTDAHKNLTKEKVGTKELIGNKILKSLKYEMLQGEEGFYFLL
jgi:hypothetical protein